MTHWLAKRICVLAGLVALCGPVSEALSQFGTSRPDADQNIGPARERRRVQRLEQAKELLAPSDPTGKQDITQGLRLLQSILEDGRQDSDELGAEDVFLETTDDPPPDAVKEPKPQISLKSEVRRVLGSLPAESRQAYETLFGAGARAALDAALTAKSWQGVEEVARRWLHTKAGDDAAEQLAARAFDLGDPLGASRRWAELWESRGARSARDPELSLRLAVALRLAGREAQCRQVLAELHRSAPDQRIVRAGTTEPLPWPTADDDWLTWLDRWSGAALPSGFRNRVEVRSDWPLAFGNASRNGVGASAVPTDQPQWSRSLLGKEAADSEEAAETTASGAEDSSQTENMPTSPSTRTGWAAVRAEARSRIEEARQAEQPVLPTGTAIVVNGVVVSRTLSHVQAWRLSDGERLWYSAITDPELTELLGRRRRGRTDRNEQQEFEHVVHQRLWEDRGQASLSSDGEFVFSLHDRSSSLDSPPLAWRGLLVPQEHNSLVATELTTGRLRWEIGGRRGDHELPNAGLFFLGPPLPWRGRLFVLAEDGPEIRLLVLNPRDGHLLWTQVLSMADPQWFGARHDAALAPTVAGELVICPTGSGRVVAVDPIRRELVWQHEYREPLARPIPTRRFDFHASPVESFWSQGEIVSAGDRLLLAAPDHNELICLSVVDGRVLWQRALADSLFVAGSTNSTVLIVGRSECQALRLADGEPAWERPISLAAPSGRGAVIDGVLHQPNIRGEVVSIDTASGHLLAMSKTPEFTSGKRRIVLGNLIAAEQRIVSVSAEYLTVFPGLGDLERELAEQLAANPNDAAALERRGRMALHLGNRERGMAELRRAVALQPTPTAKRQLVDLLMAELHGDLNEQQSEALIREVEPLIADSEQRLRFARLRAEHWTRHANWMSAAREYLKLADTFDPDAELEVTDGARTARLDRWVAARLAAVRESMSAADQSSLDMELQSRLKAAIETDDAAALRKFLSLFGWSGSATAARSALIERLDPKKQRHRFEMEAALFGLRRRGSLAVQASATGQLARYWLSLGQVERSRTLLDELATRFANEVCVEGQTGGQLAQRWREEFKKPLDVAWPGGKLSILPEMDVAIPAGKGTTMNWSAGPDAFHEFWRLEFDPALRALVARDGANRVQWLAKQPFEDEVVPAQVGRSAQIRSRYALVNLGHRFVVLDTIAAAGSDQPAARVLWQHVLYDRRTEQDLTPATGRAPAAIGGAPDRYQMIDSSGRRLGRPAIVNDEVAGYQTGTRLTAAELATGETLWTVEGLPFGCELSGDDEVLVATAPDTGEAFVFNILDGRLIARRPNMHGIWLTTFGRNRLTWSAGNRESELRLTDVVTDRDVRKEQLEANSRPCLSLLDTLTVFEPTGRWRLWRLADGSQLLDAKVPAIGQVSHVVALRDRDRWMLLTHADDDAEIGRAKARVEPMHFSHWRVNGPAFAFDRATGKQLWSTTIVWQGVNAAQPADSPLLVFAGNAYLPQPAVPNQPRTVRNQLRFEVLDRRSGELIQTVDQFGPFNHIEQRPNLDTKTVDLLIDQVVFKNNTTQIERRLQRAVAR